MSEYWKSTPKYWCKHCATFIRDTKLERQNHESTAKHQSAIKRSLRDIHRTAENAEREKERARREIDRLNGVVTSSPKASSSGASSSRATVSGTTAAPKQMTEAERQKQLEQLAELGVSIPDELRGTMAMAGEWTVTNVRVVEEEEGGETKVVGVKRDRERTEEEKEAEEAIRGLFGKRRKWGRDSKVVGEEDGELEELLSGPLVKKEVKKEEEVKKEVSGDEETGSGEVKKEVAEETPVVKKEPSDDAGLGDVGVEDAGSGVAPEVKEETPAVVFKKRKPKNVRQK
ncbi:hypothetical protein OQA88_2635 [Cercophora sp. LCS_1]